jgi:arsenate reductase
MPEVTAPSVVALYWLPHCSTCVKAHDWLLAHGVSVVATHDIKAERLPLATVEALVAGIGSAEALFSKRAMKYRQLGLHEQTLSHADMLKWMHEEYTFIKRPVLLLSNGQVLAGFSAKTYASIWS